MREIKYRGRRLDNGAWEYGDLVQFGQKCYTPCKCAIIPGAASGSDPLCKVLLDYEVDPATVGQYTGLKDKNGEKIYEGDIVEWENLMKTNMRSVIAYRDRMFCFVDANNEPEEIWCCSFTKIGNIHDTPELLKTE